MNAGPDGSLTVDRLALLPEFAGLDLRALHEPALSPSLSRRTGEGARTLTPSLSRRTGEGARTLTPSLSRRTGEGARRAGEGSVTTHRADPPGVPATRRRAADRQTINSPAAPLIETFCLMFPANNSGVYVPLCPISSHNHHLVILQLIAS
jgi:hypothetical protein